VTAKVRRREMVKVIDFLLIRKEMHWYESALEMGSPIQMEKCLSRVMD
jgi:hypothetical protein